MNEIVTLNGVAEPIDGDIARRFITDVARIWEQVLPLELVKSRYGLTDRDWAKLAKHEALVKAVKEEMCSRVHSNAVARERSQVAYAKAPAVVENILTSEEETARNKLEAAKLLRGMASGEGNEQAADRERFVIHIDLSGGVAGGEVLHFDMPIKPIGSDQPVIDVSDDEATGRE